MESGTSHKLSLPQVVALAIVYTIAFRSLCKVTANCCFAGWYKLQSVLYGTTAKSPLQEGVLVSKPLVPHHWLQIST
jgi:hypothetical protein